MESKATMNWLELPRSTARPWLDIGLQVTDTTERVMQLHILASAGDAARTCDLRCRARKAQVACAEYLTPQRPFSGISQ